MALGHCSHEHYPVLFEDLPGLVEEYSRTKQRRGTAARPEEVRLCLHPLVACRQHCCASKTSFQRSASRVPYEVLVWAC